MGAYKDYKNKIEAVQSVNAGLDYALLRAGTEVCEAAKKPDGSIDFKKIGEKPADFTAQFNKAMDGYLMARLKVAAENWGKYFSQEVKSRLLKSFGIVPKLVEHFIGNVVAGGRLMNLGATMQEDEAFQPYLANHQEELQDVSKVLEDGYKNDRVETVKEALDDFKMSGIVKPEAVGLKDLGLLTTLAAKVPADKLEETIRKLEPRLLVSSYS